MFPIISSSIVGSGAIQSGIRHAVQSRIQSRVIQSAIHFGGRYVVAGAIAAKVALITTSVIVTCGALEKAAATNYLPTPVSNLIKKTANAGHNLGILYSVSEGIAYMLGIPARLTDYGCFLVISVVRSFREDREVEILNEIGTEMTKANETLSTVMERAKQNQETVRQIQIESDANSILAKELAEGCKGNNNSIDFCNSSLKKVTDTLGSTEEAYIPAVLEREARIARVEENISKGAEAFAVTQEAVATTATQLKENVRETSKIIAALAEDVKRRQQQTELKEKLKRERDAKLATHRVQVNSNSLTSLIR